MALPASRRKARVPIDLAALAVAPAGLAAIGAAQFLGGVPFQALVQIEAALIVFGGTLGAVLVSYPPRDVLDAGRAAARTFLRTRADLDMLSTTIVSMAVRVYRRGLMSIESEVEGLTDPYLRQGLVFAMDESSVDGLKSLLVVDSAARTAADEAPARLLETAAGYAPTFGILGAVLGLIHVMRNLGAPGTLGSGIAVAFVATVYGLGAANIVLLPLAGRIRERAAAAARRRELMAHGICAIHQRVHPRILAHKLRAFGARPAPADERAARLARPDRGTRVPA